MPCNCSPLQKKQDAVYGDPSVNSALVIGGVLLLVFLVGFAIFAFRGQQTGTDLSKIGETSAQHGIYGYQGLQDFSPTSISLGSGSSPV